MDKGIGINHRHYNGLLVGLKAGESEKIMGLTDSVFDGHLSCKDGDNPQELNCS